MKITSRYRVMIPVTLSPAMKQAEAGLQDSLDRLEARKASGDLDTDVEAYAAKATADFEVAVADIGLLVAAWHHRARLAQLPDYIELRAILEEDVRNELDAQELLSAAAFSARTEADKLDIDRDVAATARRLELRRQALAELVERIAKREEMVANAIQISHQGQIVACVGALRRYREAIDNALADRIPEAA